MLDEIQGETLTGFPGDVLDDRVLQWYDGPRLRLVKTAGETHLAIWNDSQEGVERWIYLRVGTRRLGDLLRGRMPLLEALRDPEDGTLVVLDDNDRGHTRAVRTKMEQVDPTSWPAPEANLGPPRTGTA